MRIVTVEGFSSTRGEKRLSILFGELSKKFPGTEILILEYFERYGRIGKLFRKGTIKQYAYRVSSLLKKEKSMPTILIGYSMGGLVIRYLVEKMGFSAKAVILVGTPNRGIELSWSAKQLQRVFRIPCVEEISEGSKFLSFLNRRSQRLMDYYLIGSRKDEKISFSSSLPKEMIKCEKTWVLDTSHSNLMPRKGEKTKLSAIPIILKILKKEVEGAE